MGLTPSCFANSKPCVDEKNGSSVVGLMKGYMLDDYDTGEKKEDGSPKMGTRLWDANAIEKVDDRTLRLNLKTAQVAVPEHLFHYPLAALVICNLLLAGVMLLRAGRRRPSHA